VCVCVCVCVCMCVVLLPLTHTHTYPKQISRTVPEHFLIAVQSPDPNYMKNAKRSGTGAESNYMKNAKRSGTSAESTVEEKEREREAKVLCGVRGHALISLHDVLLQPGVTTVTGVCVCVCVCTCVCMCVRTVSGV